MRVEPNKPAIVYIAVNRKNGKRYIGVTSLSLARRRSDHKWGAIKRSNNGAFHRAIRKYGIDVFDFRVLKDGLTISQAFAEEIRLIALTKPEYNSTMGGDGNLGRIVTKKMRDTCRRMHGGKKYMLGKKHTEETKALLRSLALTKESRERFDKYRSIGPTSSSKRVVVLDDGLIFESASEAARFYGVDKSVVIEVCGRKPHRVTAGGKVFRYFGDHHGGEQEASMERERAVLKKKSSNTNKKKGVVCLTDGNVFQSIAEAARHYRISRGNLATHLSGNRYKNIGGMAFSYAAVET